MKPTIVVVKEVTGVDLLTGVYRFKDYIYHLNKKSASWLASYLLKEGFSFRVGMRSNNIIEDKNYFEIIEDSFVPIETINTEKNKKADKLISILNKYGTLISIIKPEEPKVKVPDHPIKI